MLAAASIAGSLLGAKTSHGSLDIGAILPLVAFVLCLSSAIWVLLPHAFVFSFRGEALLPESDHQDVHDITEASGAGGIWIGPYVDANRDKLGELSAWFTCSCVLLAVEVPLWTISLAS